MGAVITMLGAKNAQGSTGNVGIYLGITAVTGFAFLFILAIRNIRKPDIHRRLILLAMLPILPPGIHRLYMVPLGLDAFPVVAMYLTLNAMAIAIIIQEWSKTGTINKYTIIGVSWIVMQQVVHATVVNTEFLLGWCMGWVGLCIIAEWLLLFFYTAGYNLGNQRSSAL